MCIGTKTTEQKKTTSLQESSILQGEERSGIICKQFPINDHLGTQVTTKVSQ
jgi:hypothetical protein